jgi:hypothetical protein
MDAYFIIFDDNFEEFDVIKIKNIIFYNYIDEHLLKPCRSDLTSRARPD